LCRTKRARRPKSGRSTSSSPGTVLHLSYRLAARTVRPRCCRLHVDASLASESVLCTEERDRRKSDHLGQCARRVSLHGRPPSRRTTSDWWTSNTRSRIGLVSIHEGRSFICRPTRRGPRSGRCASTASGLCRSELHHSRWVARPPQIDHRSSLSDRARPDCR
jgi:hypothetical protein